MRTNTHTHAHTHAHTQTQTHTNTHKHTHKHAHRSTLNTVCKPFDVLLCRGRCSLTRFVRRTSTHTHQLMCVGASLFRSTTNPATECMCLQHMFAYLQHNALLSVLLIPCIRICRCMHVQQLQNTTRTRSHLRCQHVILQCTNMRAHSFQTHPWAQGRTLTPYMRARIVLSLSLGTHPWAQDRTLTPHTHPLHFSQANIRSLASQLHASAALLTELARIASAVSCANSGNIMALANNTASVIQPDGA